MLTDVVVVVVVGGGHCQAPGEGPGAAPDGRGLLLSQPLHDGRAE